LSDPVGIPDAPASEEDMLKELRVLLDSSINAAHPGYVGHMDSFEEAALRLPEMARILIGTSSSLTLSWRCSCHRPERTITQPSSWGCAGFSESHATTSSACSFGGKIG
jgi:hypothetical protein